MSDLSGLINPISIFARIKQALTGLLVGPLIVAGSAYGLFWNEGRAVAVAKSLREGAKVVIEVPDETISPTNENKLVYVTGNVTTEETPQDDQLDISAPGLHMERVVETYAWVETSKSRSNSSSRSYSYDKKWTTNVQSTESFNDKDGHENPRPLAGGGFWNVGDARLGAFRIEPGQVRAFGVRARVQLQPGQERKASELIETDKPFSVIDGRIYIGNPAKLQLGDTRISYIAGAEGLGSIVARQTAGGFSPYQATNGKEVYLTAVGTKPAAAMFATAQQENIKVTFIFRFMGLVGVWLGFSAFFGIFRLIPFGGGLVNFGINLVAGVGAALVGALSIGIGWLRYRPVIGGGVLAIGLVLAAVILWGGLRRQGKTRMSGQLAPG